MKKYIPLWLLAMLFTANFGSAQNADVWDFGAEQLNPALYNNQLNVGTINSFYSNTITPGTSGNNFPTAFTAGILSWVGNAGDRLRTSTAALTKYDTNLAGISAYSGRLYTNGTPNLAGGIPTNRFLRMALAEDDEVTFFCRADAAANLTMMNETNPAALPDVLPVTYASGALTEAKFVAKTAGNYKIYSADGKLSFYRIIRKAAVYTAVTGTVDLTQAPGIPNGYAVIFKNAAGKTWTGTVSGGTYSVSVPVGYQYDITLANANGYLVTAGNSFNTTGVTTPTANHNIGISAITLYSVVGNVSGLGANIANMSLNFTPDPMSGTLYTPIAAVASGSSTYMVSLEAGILYHITASGVNDFKVTPNTITIPAQNTTADLVFTQKPKHPVAISTVGLSSAPLSGLNLKFTNINEPSYVYNFSDLNTIALRNGTYSISAGGLDYFPLQLALTSNLTVNNGAVSKILTFTPVKNWLFNTQTITTANSAYKGLLFTGNISNAVAQGHLIAQPASTIQVPVHPGEKLLISYYYSANFSIDGGAPVSTVNSTGSTAVKDNVQYIYTGTSPGFVTIAASATTYFTEFKVVPNIAYSSTLTVGAGKDYPTISKALDAITNIVRASNQRVTVLIDAGNYEEMLVINQPNVTLKNAAPNPGINLLNAGVNIGPGAVRITSYYGHGYNYYSMDNNQKWNQEVLNINTLNGNFSNTNAGAGTTNGSYWNATVVVAANGFEAENIIFENSFNQYISAKEAQDIVIPYALQSPGPRPANAGNTAVQNKNLVERAAAIAFINGVDKAVLNRCRVVGRQDSFFGGTGARIAVYKGVIMGAVDYIFGGMDAVFYQTHLAMNISDATNDSSYLTAAQQTFGRGYLMYECTITSAQPLVETASVYRAKPGYFGRPWQANTSEAVFYNTTIETSNFPGSAGNSLILPLGWLDTLGGTSSGMYEYGTTEQSGINNSPSRANWATKLSSPFLNDGTAITTFNFTKGNDGWDPFPALIAASTLGTGHLQLNSSVEIFGGENNIKIANIKSETEVAVYAMNGGLIKSFSIKKDAQFNVDKGIYLITVKSKDGSKSLKVRVH